MPGGGGFEPVIQPFESDWSKYLPGFDQGIAKHQEFIRSIADVQRQITELNKARIDIDSTGALASIRAVKSALGDLPDRKVITIVTRYVTEGDRPGAGLGGDAAAVIRDITAATADSTGAARDAAAAQAALGDATGRTVTVTTGAQDSVRAYRSEVDQLAVSIAKAGDAASRAGTAGTREFLRGMEDARRAAASVTAAAAAGAFPGGGAGSGGAGLGAAAAALGGGGGGPDPGTAAAAFATAAGFVRRWYPAFHWGMMLTNELLATVGPAVVAGGAAAAVGAQGGQQVANRLQAIYSVAESLGPSLGTTAGQFLGGGNALQQAQNLAGGGVYELLGGGINIAKTSASGAFAQLGLNTVAMLDRATAGIVTDFRGGEGAKLAGLVSGGTGYLQQFGDVAANIGHTFLNVAPNLPGVGGDLLSTLQAGTGGLSRLTGALGPALGPILAFEAGARWGPALVGGAGRLLSTAGRPLITAGTTLAGDAVGATAAGSGGLLADLGLSAGLGITGAGTGLARGGAFLGGLGAPAIGTIAAAVYTMVKGITAQTPFQQQVGSMLSQVGQSGPAAGLPSIISDMQKLAGTPYSAPDTSEGGALKAIWGPFTKMGWSPSGGFHAPSPGNIFHQLTSSIHGAWEEITTGTTGPTNFQVAQQGLQSLSDSMVNALGTGKQVQGVWKGLTGSTLSMADAYNVATMAQLQLGSAFEKNGKLTATAKTMIGNLEAGYAPMVMNTGQFGAATGAVTAMQGLSKTQLSTVNSSLDQLVQIVSGGAAGTAAYSGLLAALPSGTKQALTGFTSPASSAAWTAFASTTQPSVISQLQQQTDWQRTAQTLGALGPGQTTGMTAYLLGQALPSARSSPAALSMLSTIAQEYGGPAIRPGESAAGMFQSLNHWVKQFGETGKQFNQAMTTGTEKLSSIPQDAQQFVQTAQGNVTSQLAMGIATYGSGLQNTFLTSIGKSGMGAATGAYAGFLKHSGVPEQAAVDMAQYAGQIGGASKQQLAQIKQQIDLTYGPPPKAPAVSKPPPVTYDSKVQPPHVPLAKGRVNFDNFLKPVPAQHASGVVNYTSHLPPAPTGPTGHGVIIYTAQMAGAPGGARLIGGQTGFKVPGYGGGDVWGPAMLEPGELVVPKDMVAGGAVDHLRGQIPGFQSGGLAGVSVPNITGVGVAFRIAMQDVMNQLVGGLNEVIGNIHGSGAGGTGAMAPPPLPAAAQKVIDSFEHTFSGMGNPWGKLASQILTGLEDGITNAKGETAKMAQTLVSKVTTEVNYAKSVASGTLQGLNIAGMQVPATGSQVNMNAAAPGTKGYNPAQWNAYIQAYASDSLPGGTNAAAPAQSVQQQMQSYLKSIQAFRGDIGTLSKDHLNKDVLKQLIGAGPVQGDALAQSILGGKGGVGAVNALYKQIQSASNQLGITAGQDVYGYGQGSKNVKVGVHADTAAAQAAINSIHGKSVTVNVNLRSAVAAPAAAVA